MQIQSNEESAPFVLRNPKALYKKCRVILLVGMPVQESQRSANALEVTTATKP